MLKIILCSLGIVIILFVLGYGYLNAGNINNSEKTELKSENSIDLKKFEYPLENNILEYHFQLIMPSGSLNNHAKDGMICNFSYTECEFGRIKVTINNIFDLETRKKYLREIASKANNLANKIYQIIHQGKDIESEELFRKISIADDFSSNLAYTKLKFEDLLDSKYDMETGVYLGNIDFTYNDISGVLAHELAHYLKIPKKSGIFNDLTWIEEGVSDYVYNELGYSSVINNRYPHCDSSQNYHYGYMCAADLFIFIENKYQKNIPKEYVYMLENGIADDSYDHFTNVLFDDFVGKDVNTLWNEYLALSK